MTERCADIAKAMDDILVDVRTGREVNPRELSRDELEKLVDLSRKWNFEKCGCEITKKDVCDCAESIKILTKTILLGILRVNEGEYDKAKLSLKHSFYDLEHAEKMCDINLNTTKKLLEGADKAVDMFDKKEASVFFNSADAKLLDEIMVCSR